MSGRTAKVVRVSAFGGPEVLHIDTLNLDAPGRGEALVRTGAIGLNRIEAMYRAGAFGQPALPARIGYEAAGVVDAVGEGVTAVAPGDRVATIPGLDMERHGTCAEAFLYPADMLVVLPDGQPFAEAAASWMAFLTAYHLAEERLVRPGAAVLITAASSSVGLAAIQVTRREGGVPIALTRTRAKADALRRHGAEHIVATQEEDLVRRVEEITSGAGAACAFDAVAGPMVGRLAEAMSPGGSISLYGALDGEQTVMPVFTLMSKGLKILGFSANQVTLTPGRLAGAIDYIRSGLSDGAFSPVIDSRFRFDAIVEAHRRLESNSQVGKIVVDLG